MGTSIHQPTHRHIPVDTAAAVLAHTRVRVDKQILVSIAHPLGDIERWTQAGYVTCPVDAAPAGITELDPACGVFGAGKAAFVHQAVMKPAKLYEIGEFYLAPLAPVRDVMTIDGVLVRTPGNL